MGQKNISVFCSDDLKITAGTAAVTVPSDCNNRDIEFFAQSLPVSEIIACMCNQIYIFEFWKYFTYFIEFSVGITDYKNFHISSLPQGSAID